MDVINHTSPTDTHTARTIGSRGRAEPCGTRCLPPWPCGMGTSRQRQAVLIAPPQPYCYFERARNSRRSHDATSHQCTVGRRGALGCDTPHLFAHMPPSASMPAAGPAAAGAYADTTDVIKLASQTEPHTVQTIGKHAAAPSRAVLAFYPRGRMVGYPRGLYGMGLERQKQATATAPPQLQCYSNLVAWACSAKGKRR